MLASAIEAAEKTQQGCVTIFNISSFELMGIAPVGVLPYMVTFSPDGKFVLSADEGEASEDYSTDPEGSISVIALPQ